MEYFLAVVDEQSFTRAAARCHVTQPTISAAVHALERELGEQLFDRTSRGVALTDGGRLLLPHARRAVAAGDDARAEFSARRGLHRGQLRLGTGGGVERTTVPELLGAFRRRYPGIDVELREGTSLPLMTQVVEGALHLAIIAQQPDPLPAVLDFAPMFGDELVAAFDPSVFSVPTDPMDLAALAAYPVISYPTTSALRRALDIAAAKVSASLDVSYVANDVRLQLALAAQGIGVAVCAGSDPALHSTSALVIRDLDPAPYFEKVLIWRRDGQPPAVRAFLDLWHERMTR
ncbi:LysR substrate-binding domain-containing protein [Gordonia jinhuaensis]|uniref:LysR family transcriptional regulator n=1 Tax=Gordonia jinhuaensis TaxID=1517702 RepID=A0A916T5K9_9ACTN|nr:LysR family transcriptional regulator [Gordonia jinhuaensis]